MSWAKVKKINSDMSTPLDKLIIGSKRFVTSDTIIKNLANNVAVGRDYVTLGSFTPKIPATIRIWINVDRTSSDYSLYLQILNSSGTSVNGFTIDLDEKQKYVDINISANTYRQFKIRTSSSSFNANVTVGIGAQVVDAQYFT